MNTPSILQKIIQTKHQEVAALKSSTDFARLQEQADQYTPKGFARALHHAPLGVIAEIKKASPSKGIIAAHFDPVQSALGYQKAGASCLSVLTDEQYFLGSDEYLKQVRAAVDLPILRKDFMIDPAQILAAKAMGADCILLIVACLEYAKLYDLHAYAVSLGLDVLLEMHTEDEVDAALQLPHSTHNLYGINNRNLNTFVVDLHTSTALADVIFRTQPEALVISESGIHSPQDVHTLQKSNIHHYLIGEQFMKTPNPGQALDNFLQAI